jgi:hypothetical protein
MPAAEMRACAACGRPFPVYPSWRGRKNLYCLRACRSVGVRKARLCRVCGTAFTVLRIDSRAAQAGQRR